MDEDISKNTLVVLIALTVIISLLGSYSVLYEASQLNTNQQNQASSTQGKVSLTIKQAPVPASTTGRVVLNIIDDKET